MSFQRLRRALLLALCASSALLAACGGGNVESQLVPSRIIAFGDGFSDLGQGGTRYTVNDSSVNATIGSRLTPLSTGVAPSRMRLYSITVSGASDPTRLGTIA